MRRALFLVMMLLLSASVFAAGEICSPAQFSALNTAGFVNSGDFEEVTHNTDGSITTSSGETIRANPDGGYTITDRDGESRNVQISGLTNNEEGGISFITTETRADGTTITRQYDSGNLMGTTQVHIQGSRSTTVQRNEDDEIILEQSRFVNDYYREVQTSQEGRTTSSFTLSDQPVTLTPSEQTLVIADTTYTQTADAGGARVFSSPDGASIALDQQGRLISASGLQEEEATALRAEITRQLIQGDVESGISQDAVGVAADRGTGRVTVDDLQEAQRQAEARIAQLAGTQGRQQELRREKAELAGLYITTDEGELATDQYPLQVTDSGDILTADGVPIGTCSGGEGGTGACKSASCTTYPCDLDLQPGAEVCKATNEGQSCANMVSCGEDAPPGCVRSSSGPRNAPWSPTNIVDFVRGGPATQGLRSLGNVFGFRRDLDDAAAKFPKLFGTLRGIDISSSAAQRLCSGEIDPGEGISAVALSAQGGYLVPSMTKQRQSLTIGDEETCTANCTYRYVAIVKLNTPEFEFDYNILLREIKGSGGNPLFKTNQHLNKSTPANIVLPFNSSKEYQEICIKVLHPHDDLVYRYYQIENSRFPKSGVFCADVFEGDRNEKTFEELDALAGGVPEIEEEEATATQQDAQDAQQEARAGSSTQCAYGDDIRACTNTNI